MKVAHYPILAIAFLAIVLAVIVIKMPMEKLNVLLRGLRDTFIHFTQLQHFKNVIYLIFVITAVRCVDAVISGRMKGDDELGILSEFLYLFGVITAVYFTGKDSTKSNGEFNNNKNRRSED